MTSVLYPDLPDTGNPGYWKLRNRRSSSVWRSGSCVRVLGRTSAGLG
jgi:hypothetical protein